jgi:hypothetical protein
VSNPILIRAILQWWSKLPPQAKINQGKALRIVAQYFPGSLSGLLLDYSRGELRDILQPGWLAQAQAEIAKRHKETVRWFAELEQLKTLLEIEREWQRQWQQRMDKLNQAFWSEVGGYEERLKGQAARDKASDEAVAAFLQAVADARQRRLKEKADMERQIKEGEQRDRINEELQRRLDEFVPPPPSFLDKLGHRIGEKVGQIADSAIRSLDKASKQIEAGREAFVKEHEWEIMIASKPLDMVGDLAPFLPRPDRWLRTGNAAHFVSGVTWWMDKYNEVRFWATIADDARAYANMTDNPNDPRSKRFGWVMAILRRAPVTKHLEGGMEAASGEAIFEPRGRDQLPRKLSDVERGERAIDATIGLVSDALTAVGIAEAAAGAIERRLTTGAPKLETPGGPRVASEGGPGGVREGGGAKAGPEAGEGGGPKSVRK